MSKQRFFVIGNFLVLLLSSVSAHAIDENEKCMQALLEATEECEKGDLAENKVVNIREACFCGPIQGNTPTGSCNSQKNNDSSFFFVRNGKGRTSSATDDGNPVTFIKKHQDGSSCFAENFFTIPRTNENSTEDERQTRPSLVASGVNFCKITTKTQINKTDQTQTRENSFQHKTTIIRNNKTITMKDLIERLRKKDCGQYKKIIKNKELINEDSEQNVLYVAEHNTVSYTNSTPLKLGADNGKNGIILGRDITIDTRNSSTDKNIVAHILSYGTVNIKTRISIHGGINANKIDYQNVGDNVEHIMYYPSDAPCRSCLNPSVQKDEYRITQKRGSNKCEDTVLKVEECQNGNDTTCTPVSTVQVKITNNGKDTTYDVDANGYVRISELKGNFTASVLDGGSIKNAYCNSSDTNTSASCAYTSDGTCEIQAYTKIESYINETVPVKLTMVGDNRVSFYAPNDADGSKTTLQITAKIISKNTDVVLKSDNSAAATKTTIASNTTKEQTLYEPKITYDAQTNQTIITGNITIDSLLLENNAYISEISLKATNKEASDAETIDNTKSLKLYTPKTSTTEGIELLTAPYAFCINVNNASNNILQAGARYTYTQNIIACPNGTTCSDIPSQSTLTSNCQKCLDDNKCTKISNTAITTGEHVAKENLLPLYRSTFNAWFDNPSEVAPVPTVISKNSDKIDVAYSNIKPMDALDNTKLISLGFSDVNNGVIFDENGWASFSTYPAITMLDSKKSYFTSPIYTIIPAYLNLKTQDLYNYYSVTNSDSIIDVSDSITAPKLNGLNCPAYYNQDFLLHLEIEANNKLNQKTTNLRGYYISDSTDNLKSSLAGFYIKNSNEEQELIKKSNTTVSVVTEENNLNISDSKIGNWQVSYTSANEVNSSYFISDFKFAVPSQSALPKNIFLAAAAKTKICKAPNAKITSDSDIECNIDIATTNEVGNTENALNKGALQKILADYFEVATTTVNSISDHINNTNFTKDKYVFLSGPILKNIAIGRIVSQPITGTSSKLFVPIALHYLDRNNTWSIRPDACTKLYLTDDNSNGFTLKPNVFFKTAQGNLKNIDKNTQLLELSSSTDTAKITFCENSKTNCDDKTYDFSEGVIWLQAYNVNNTHKDKNSYGLLQFKTNLDANDNKTIEHLIYNNASQGGFLFKPVMNNARIIYQDVK